MLMGGDCVKVGPEELSGDTGGGGVLPGGVSEISFGQ